MESKTKKEFFIKATFKKDYTTGIKKLVGIHFPTETIRNIIDKSFIQSGKTNK